MGRPIKDEKSERIVAVRMTDAEYNRLKKYAELHQMTLTNVIKKAVDSVCKEK